MFSTITTPENIIIADDHPLFRQALLNNLKPHFEQCSWHEAQNVDELEKQLHDQSSIDLLLLDLNIPGAHGFNTLIHVRSHFPEIPVVVVSAYEDNQTVQQAMQYGAMGFIPKSTPTEKIIEGIESVLSGKNWSPELPKTPTESSDDDISQRVASLTQQQYRILMMFADGLLNKQIAYDLGVSEATIKAHATAIFRKLNVRNRTQAVIAISPLSLTPSSFSSSSE